MKKLFYLIMVMVLAFSFATTANANPELVLETIYLEDVGHGEYHEVAEGDGYDLTATQTKINFNYYSLEDGYVNSTTVQGVLKVDDGVYQLVEMGHYYSIASLKLCMKRYDLPSDVYNGIGNMQGTEDAYIFLTPEGVYYEVDGVKLEATTVTFVEKTSPIDVLMPDEFTARKQTQMSVPTEIMESETQVWYIHLNHSTSRVYISEVDGDAALAVMDYSTCYADNTIKLDDDSSNGVYQYNETPKYYTPNSFGELNSLAISYIGTGDRYEALEWEKIRSYLDYLGDELSDEEVQETIDLVMGNTILSSLTGLKQGIDTLITFGVMVLIAGFIVRQMLKYEAKKKLKK